MNIFKRELRAGLKPFVFWMIGMFLLCYVGIIKYQSYTTSGSMTELLNSFPRVLLAVMGAIGVDIGTLGGYTALLFYYVLVCAVIYAVHLGASAVTRESVDKTYEFVFTKPCSRSRVLGMKLVSSYAYLLLFCILNGLFSNMAVGYLKTSENIVPQIWFGVLTVFLIGAMFVAVSAFFASAAKRPDKGMLYGNLAFLYAFILGVVYNMLENPGLLKLISPFSYFSPADLVLVRFDPVYAAVTLVLTAGCLIGAFSKFKSRDLA
jgi:ABC-2 type transport system permease protein